MSEFTRRLPVYLLLDISGSMQGEPIEALKNGISALLTELKSDPQALETAYLSVITFNSVARQLTPLTELMLFTEPELRAAGATALGAALSLLSECIESEVKKSSPTQKGDWKPLVFILTDGAPTDDWRAGLAALKRAGAANIIACAAGAVADTKVLKEITPNVVMMNSSGAGDLARFFTWVSASVKITSKAFDAKPGGLELPPPPQGFIIVP
ncbi:MAG: VWA domain-containing protein [Ruminococcus sp.]|nr:VWA domain-containing protein [Ruminococcus sp.]